MTAKLALLAEVAEAAREVPLDAQPERLRAALASLALDDAREVEEVIDYGWIGPDRW